MSAEDPERVLERLLTPAELALLRPAPPAFVAPMLATPAERSLAGDHASGTGSRAGNWLYERKLDGVRLIAVRAAGGTRLYSRNHRENTATFPEIAAALTAAAPPGLVADGEVVAFDGTATSFARLQGRLGLADTRRIGATGIAVVFYLFDLLGYAGQDLTRLPLRTRKRVLRAAVAFTDPLRFSTHRSADGEAYLREACARGWEGLIAKRADSRYEPGRRSPQWRKLKCVREQEFVIAGFTDSPTAGRTGFGALLLGYHDASGLRYAGKVGTGFDQQTLRALRACLDDLAMPACPFVDPPRARGLHWVDPLLVAQIGFTEWTPDGKLRHPRYLGLRDDKDAREVTRD